MRKMILFLAFLVIASNLCFAMFGEASAENDAQAAVLQKAERDPSSLTTDEIRTLSESQTAELFGKLAESGPNNIATLNRLFAERYGLAQKYNFIPGTQFSATQITAPNGKTLDFKTLGADITGVEVTKDGFKFKSGAKEGAGSTEVRGASVKGDKAGGLNVDGTNVKPDPNSNTVINSRKDGIFIQGSGKTEIGGTKFDLKDGGYIDYNKNGNFKVDGHGTYQLQNERTKYEFSGKNEVYQTNGKLDHITVPADPNGKNWVKTGADKIVATKNNADVFSDPAKYTSSASKDKALFTNDRVARVSGGGYEIRQGLKTIASRGNEVYESVRKVENGKILAPVNNLLNAPPTYDGLLSKLDGKISRRSYLGEATAGRFDADTIKGVQSWLTKYDPNLQVTGTFDEATKKALMAYQADYQSRTGTNIGGKGGPDGNLGVNTLKAMKSDFSDLTAPGIQYETPKGSYTIAGTQTKAPNGAVTRVEKSSLIPSSTPVTASLEPGPAGSNVRDVRAFSDKLEGQLSEYASKRCYAACNAESFVDTFGRLPPGGTNGPSAKRFVSMFGEDAQVSLSDVQPGDVARARGSNGDWSHAFRVVAVASTSEGQRIPIVGESADGVAYINADVPYPVKLVDSSGANWVVPSRLASGGGHSGMSVVQYFRPGGNRVASTRSYKSTGD